MRSNPCAHHEHSRPPGRDATLALGGDSGRTYDYAKDGRITVLHWNNRTRRLTHTGAKAGSVPDSKLIEVIHAMH